MGIRQKLIIGFGLIVLFLLGQSAITVHYVSKSKNLVTNAIQKDFNASNAISRIAIEGQKLRRYEKEFFIYANNTVKREKYVGEWDDAFINLASMLKDILEDTSGNWSDADKVEIGKWDKALKDYGEGFKIVVANVNAGYIKGTLDANTAIQDAKNKFKVLLKGASKGGQQKFESASSSAREIENNFKIVNLVIMVASGASIVLVIILLVVVPAAITKPIAELTRAAEVMSTGNLSSPVPKIGGSEFAGLRDTLERMRISQKTLIQRTKSGTASSADDFSL
ncbi:MAG: HAMP domain-containing protein [Acidiferrobacterales bacterium]